VGEFELIQHYFAAQAATRADVELGIGDDCALLNVPTGECLAVSTDTLVSGVHFFADVDPVALGHKALAVNLSDLAAMGAQITYGDNWIEAKAELASIRWITGCWIGT